MVTIELGLLCKKKQDFPVFFKKKSVTIEFCWAARMTTLWTDSEGPCFLHCLLYYKGRC